MESGHKAFSLTELLIVLVVVALLFAALAPILTKRHVSENAATESIWNFVPGDGERNVYFDPGNESWTSSIYMGMVPSRTINDSNSGKLVIDSGDITYNSVTYKQPQIQFRFSPDIQQQGRGLNSANLFVDETNLIFGPSLVNTNLSQTTIYGLSNLKNPSSANALTIMGKDAMGNANVSENGLYNYIIAIGNRAAYNLGTDTSSINGIYIGANSGAGSAETDTIPTDNVAIGYNTSNKAGFAGSGNVFLGAFTGNGFNNAASNYNTIVGSVFYGENAAYNTLIGYGTYQVGDSNIKNITAIGYGACNSVENVSDGSRICIGYNSGYSTNYTPSSFNTDSGEHIFLGGKPEIPSLGGNGFSGRSVLEVHNIPVNDINYGYVVLNSNLVVRGNFYPSNLSKQVVYNQFASTRDIGAEKEYFRCNTDDVISGSSFVGINDKYVCKGLVSARPKSINALKYNGACSNNSGYTSGSNCPNITSDIRLKNIISENTDGIDKLEKLILYNYTYKNNPKTPQVGVIAQDLQKVFPNSVSKDSQGFLKIRWDEMFYSLINSIKALAAKVEDLFSKVAKLEADVTTVKNDQSDIKSQISVINKRIKRLEKE